MEAAFLKSMISVGFTIPKKNILLSIGRIEDKANFLASAKALQRMGFDLFATEGTSDFLKDNGVKNLKLFKVSTGKSPNIIDYIGEKKLDLVIDIPKNYTRQEITDGYIIRRKAIDMNIPLLTNLQVAKLLTEALKQYKIGDLEIKSWDEYVK